MTRIAMIAAVTPAPSATSAAKSLIWMLRGRVRGLVHPVAWSTTRTENGWPPLGVIV